MPNIDLSILNQRQTPAFFADTLANRPAAGFVGRIFISTDTLDLYRDTGSAWLLLSPSSTGTITGSGAAGQVTYFSGTSSITGNNNLFWDSVNGHLGIGTITPSTALTIFHDQNQIIQLNQTTATNDTKIAFQNSGTPLWRIGNSYNAGENDYGIFDVVGAIQPLTIKKTTGQTFIGAQTTSSGRLVVNNATGDNHIVVIGATAPSLRINNSGTGATKQIGIGLATTTNNFIQGAVDRDMAIFNGSTTPSPILFGIYDAGAGNTQEAARISAARNLLIGTTTDGGQKLQVNGTASFSLSIGIAGGVPSGSNVLSANGSAIFTGGVTAGTNVTLGSGFNLTWGGNYGANIPTLIGLSGASGYITFYPSGSTNGEAARFTNSGNLLIGTTTDNGNKLNVSGNIWGSALTRSDRFVSNSSFTTNIVFNTFTTFYTMTSTYGGIYLVILCLDGQNTADWAAMAIIYTNGSSSTILTQQNGSLVQITTSGLDIQGKQTGTSPNLDMAYRVLKISNV